MQILEFNQTFIDILRFQWFLIRKQKGSIIFRICIIVFALVSWLIQFGNIKLVFTTFIVFVAGLYMILFVCLPLQTLIILSSRNRKLNGKKHYEINDEYILEKYDKGETKYCWDKFKSIYENNKYIYLSLRSISGLLVPEGLIFPKDHFKSNNELNDFKNFINSNLSKRCT